MHIHRKALFTALDNLHTKGLPSQFGRHLSAPLTEIPGVLHIGPEPGGVLLSQLLGAAAVYILIGNSSLLKFDRIQS